MQTEKVQFEVMVKKMYLMIFFFGKKRVPGAGKS